MKVIFDNNLSPALARALQELFKGQHEIIALRDKFHRAPADVEWIRELNREGNWVVISGDRRITRNRAEYQAFQNSRLVGFFLSKGLCKAKVTKQMERILALWDAMETIASTVQGGAMFELPTKSGRVQQLRER